jgi:aarF domain-containing kinase
VAGSGGLLAPGSGAALGAAAGSVGLVGLSGLLALAAPPSQQHYKLVVLDHGMYRRLDPPFRHAYCQLWRAMLLRDEALGLDAVRQLGVPAKHYEAISLIFAFRTPVSQQQTGARMDKSERDKLRAQYKDVTAGDINVFIQGLPRDLLFVLRSTNIVRSINLSLGGTTRMRFKIMGESAVRGMLVRNPSPEQIEHAIQPGLPVDGARVINKPVASELVDAETITWRQAFEMWRLRTFLELVDRSWGVLASLVKIL